MRKALACGIDFGTTNSSVSIAYDNGTVELVTIDSGATMPYSLPSIVYIDRDDLQQAGQEAVDQFMITGSYSTVCSKCDLVKIVKFGDFADYDTECKQHQPGGGCQDARLISGLKSLLAPTEIGTTHSWGRDFELEYFVAIILKELKKRVDDLAGDNIHRVVLGYPVVFSGAEGAEYQKLQERAKNRLKQAAEIAGFTDIEFFSEPSAVLLSRSSEDGYITLIRRLIGRARAVLLGRSSEDGYVLAVDFGGGTYDVAVLENKGGKAEIVARQGVAVGGEIFDGLLFKKKMADAIGLNQEPKGKTLPRWIANKMRTLAGIAQLLRDKYLQPTLDKFEDAGANVDAISEILFGGQAYNFYSKIEGAKIELSENQVVQIDCHVQDRINVSATVCRADFDCWISSELDKVDKATRAALDEAGIGPQDVHTVLRTGGSSKIPQFIDRLKSIFPNAAIKEGPVFTSVAYGLGIRAREIWGMSDDKQQPCKGKRISTDGAQGHKGIPSWIRRFWMWLRRGVWRNKKLLRAPLSDVETVKEGPPGRKGPRDVELPVTPSPELVIEELILFLMSFPKIGRLWRRERVRKLATMLNNTVNRRELLSRGLD